MRVIKRDVPSVRNYKRPSAVLGLVTVDQPFLTGPSSAARWLKYNAKKDDWVDCNAPEQVAITSSQVGHWNLPKLWSAISTPTLRPDGTVLQTPGYDADTQRARPRRRRVPQDPERTRHRGGARRWRSSRRRSAPFPRVGNRSGGGARARARARAPKPAIGTAGRDPGACDGKRQDAARRRDRDPRHRRLGAGDEVRRQGGVHQDHARGARRGRPGGADRQRGATAAGRDAVHGDHERGLPASACSARPR